MVLTSSVGAPSFFSLFGLLFIAAGIASALSVSKADAYRQAHERYQQRRAALLTQKSRR